MLASRTTRQRADTLAVREVSVHFAGLAALRNVSLTVARGEIVGLIGPNGAGKTTLLNVLSGYQRPSSGALLCGEQEVTGRRPDQIARAGVARTFQNVRVFPGLSVRENVELGALGHGIRRADARRAAHELLDEFGLAARAEAPAAALPYGGERLLGIARAIAARPDFLLLDEPAAGMDESEGAELTRHILNLRDRYGFGVVVVEHDMHLIMSVSERIHVLDYGKTLSEGPPEDVRADPVVIAAYFGDQPGADDAAA